jgi:acyl carrier protein
VARLKPTGQNAPARQFLESIGDAETRPNGELVFQFPAENLRGLEWKPASAAANRAVPVIGVDARPPRPDYARIARTLSTPAQILREMRQIRNVIGASTATEQRLGEIWADLLHIASISASDNFFDLGGHSLLAVLLLVRIHETFGVELSIDDVSPA